MDDYSSIFGRYAIQQDTQEGDPWHYFSSKNVAEIEITKDKFGLMLTLIDDKGETRKEKIPTSYKNGIWRRRDVPGSRFYLLFNLITNNCCYLAVDENNRLMIYSMNGGAVALLVIFPIGGGVGPGEGKVEAIKLE